MKNLPSLRVLKNLTKRTQRSHDKYIRLPNMFDFGGHLTRLEILIHGLMSGSMNYKMNRIILFIVRIIGMTGLDLLQNKCMKKLNVSSETIMIITGIYI